MQLFRDGVIYKYTYMQHLGSAVYHHLRPHVDFTVNGFWLPYQMLADFCSKENSPPSFCFHVTYVSSVSQPKIVTLT